MTKGPRSIGVIMDGNRRWARGRGLPQLEGHREGLARSKDMLLWAEEAGIEEITLYAFSTENWNRAAEEVAYLMDLFREGIEDLFGEVMRRDFRMQFIGERARMPNDIQRLMETCEARSGQNTRGTMVLALSYGGRAEILSAVNRVLVAGREQVTEEELRSAMWSSGLSDPDLIIRTGGEKRLSNFLTWQSVYSELFFTDTMWPDFSRKEFNGILADFASRERRPGA